MHGGGRGGLWGKEGLLFFSTIDSIHPPSKPNPIHSHNHQPTDLMYISLSRLSLARISSQCFCWFSHSAWSLDWTSCREVWMRDQGSVDEGLEC